MNYIKDNELTYHIILSQGKGRPTKMLYEMSWLLCVNSNKKLYYTNESDKQDVISESFLQLIEQYKNFNYIKFNKSLPYMTEIAKRKMALYYRENILYKGFKVHIDERDNFNFNWYHLDDIKYSNI